MKLIVRPDNLFKNILASKSLPFWKLILGGIIGAGIFGFAQGAYTGGIMFLYGAIKIPLVIIATALICLPAMYVFSFVLGIKFSVLQVSNIVVSNLYILALGLCAVVPIVWFFQNFYHKYRFNVMILVFTFSAAWLIAIYQTWRNLKDSIDRDVLLKVLGVWGFIFAFVSTQMIWLFRPWVGYTYVDEKLPFIRAPEGNVYDAVILNNQTWMERNL